MALALALFLAGAISYLPVTPAPSDQINGLQTSGGLSTDNQPAPTTAPRPQAAVSAAALSPVVFIAGAIIIGVLAVVLLFREKT